MKNKNLKLTKVTTLNELEAPRPPKGGDESTRNLAFNLARKIESNFENKILNKLVDKLANKLVGKIAGTFVSPFRGAGGFNFVGKFVTLLFSREGQGVSLRFLFFILILTLTSCGNEPTSTQTPQPKAKTDVATKPVAQKATAEKKKKIIFFGDSLTFGYGLKDPAKGYVGVVQGLLDAKGLAYEAVNSGVSGETSSGGEGRIDWVLEQYEPEIFVLELGANDGLRGIDPKVTVKNLQSIIDKVKAKYPDVKIVLAGMLAPPNMGKEFTTAFAQIYPQLAKKNNVALIPFILEGVAGIPKLNQRDKIHPTEEGHVILADNVWKVIEKML